MQFAFQSLDFKIIKKSENDITFLITLINIILYCSILKAAEWLTLYEPDYPEGAFKKDFETAKMTNRRATHSGSWYTNHGQELNRELETWLQRAGPVERPARAIISPHAG